MSTGPMAVMYSRRTSDQPWPSVWMCSASSALQVRLDAVLDETGVDAELVGGVVHDLVEQHREPVLALGVLHAPHGDDTVAACASSGFTSAIVHGGDIQLSGL